MVGSCPLRVQQHRAAVTEGLCLGVCPHVGWPLSDIRVRPGQIPGQSPFWEVPRSHTRPKKKGLLSLFAPHRLPAYVQGIGGARTGRGVAHYRVSWPAACTPGEPALQNIAVTLAFVGIRTTKLTTSTESNLSP